jgi:hypothetical protein
MNFMPPPLQAERIDRLKHFAKDSWWVKLGALLIERMPNMLYGVGLCAIAGVILYIKLH